MNDPNKFMATNNESLDIVRNLRRKREMDISILSACIDTMETKRVEKKPEVIPEPITETEDALKTNVSNESDVTEIKYLSLSDEIKLAMKEKEKVNEVPVEMKIENEKDIVSSKTIGLDIIQALSSIMKEQRLKKMFQKENSKSDEKDEKSVVIEVPVEEVKSEPEEPEEAYKKALMEANGHAPHMDEKAKERILKERASQIKARKIQKEKEAKANKNKKQPKPQSESDAKKYLILSLIAVLVSLFLGLKCSSFWYFDYGQYMEVETEASKKTDKFSMDSNKQKVEPSFTSCITGFLSTEGVPLSIEPLVNGFTEQRNGYLKVFASDAGIFALIFLVIIFFSWSSADDKKRMRVGHEHGKGHIGTPADYARYRKEFMD